MKQHLIDLLQQSLARLQKNEIIPAEIKLPPLQINLGKNPKFGDYSSNLAMLLASAVGKNPVKLAQELVDNLPNSTDVTKAVVAGNGFINFYCSTNYLRANLAQILQQAENYGRGLTKDSKTLIEFVSVNPTGPLHIGHARGAAYGDSLLRIKKFAGYPVESEYYVNDAGRQMDILTISLWLRWLNTRGVKIDFPQRAYQGEYLKKLTPKLDDAGFQVIDPKELTNNLPSENEQEELYLDALIARSRKILAKRYNQLREMVCAEMLTIIRDELLDMRVEFDHWFSEKKMLDDGSLKQAIKHLQQKGLLYQQDGASWFSSSKAGDSKDRVVRRSNGSYTYFASDIAYHQNKVERGYTELINVWGADHHGYVERIKAGLSALAADKAKLRVQLVQMVALLKAGKRYSMSTRQANFLSLREVLAETGADALRYFLVSTDINRHCDVDVDLAKQRDRKNPVYYIQYAHARIISLLEKSSLKNIDLGSANVSIAQHPLEIALLKQLYTFPELIQRIANNLEVHELTQYTRELATAFHAFYNELPVLGTENQHISTFRISLCKATATVLKTSLQLLGISAPNQM